ncbi:MAG: glutamate formimidoyltransferase [Desulfopila sp.]
MEKLIECVPNVSEGCNTEVIEAIAEAIRKVDGCTVIDVDSGRSTNRTVYTFVGHPDAVIEGALAAARVVRERIDMRHHRGEHPRFGAMDVCPFVPVRNVTIKECVEVSKRFAERAEEELAIPLYLYEASAVHDWRRSLADLREGEYEKLAERLADPRWKPDYGPARFVPEWGITATGARNFLIAYNVNILASANQAHRIALNLREAGRGPGQPGRLAAVKGMGWYVDEYNLAQVTTNLTDYQTTPIHVLFEEVRREAEALQVAVAGSELVGVVPLAAMLMAADYYIEKENLFIYQEDQKIRLAVERLGLNAVAPFAPERKIIEYIVAEEKVAPLAAMSVRGFIDEVAARTSAPGGGSASAVIAAIGAGLGAMVAKLTWGVRRFDAVQDQMKAVIPVLHEVCQRLIPMIDADTAAFAGYMEALRMPRASERERLIRREKMQEGLKTAVQVPLTTMRLADEAWQPLLVVARYGNPASRSDVQVGARALETGIWGAYQNVLINLEGIDDDGYRQEILGQATGLAERAKEKCAEVLRLLA